MAGAGYWYPATRGSDPNSLQDRQDQQRIADGRRLGIGHDQSGGDCVGWFAGSGQIKEVTADFNSEVKADQVIARIDPETFTYRMRQASADLDAARAQVLVQDAQVAARRADVTRSEVNLAEARLDLSRKEQLLERNFISSAERDKARSVMRLSKRI